MEILIGIVVGLLVVGLALFLGLRRLGTPAPKDYSDANQYPSNNIADGQAYHDGAGHGGD